MKIIGVNRQNNKLPVILSRLAAILVTILFICMFAYVLSGCGNSEQRSADETAGILSETSGEEAVHTGIGGRTAGTDDGDAEAEPDGDSAAKTTTQTTGGATSQIAAVGSNTGMITDSKTDAAAGASTEPAAATNKEAAVGASTKPTAEASTEPASGASIGTTAGASTDLASGTTATQPASSDIMPGAVVPEVSVHMTRSEYPRVDGSTATIPLSVMLARAVTGMGQEEAESFVLHTKTTESFYNLYYENNDLLIVYAPPESLFDNLNEMYQVDKSYFIMEPIGRDALIFLVNDQNPVKSLTNEQLVDIYAGEITYWQELPGDSGSGDIAAFQRIAASGSQVMMENLVMKGVEMAKAPATFVISEMGELLERVAEYNNSGNAIGYSVYYYFNNMYNIEGVRALDIDGIPCTNETIRDGSYPYVQDFYAVIRRNEPAGSNARKLFNLLTSDEGAALIESAGYVSVKGGSTAADDVKLPANRDSRPPDTLSTIKRKPAFSLFAWFFGDSVDDNLFPLTFGDKIGFVNGDGELVVEPLYDSVEPVFVFDGYRMPSYLGERNIPLYYFVEIYERDRNGVPDIKRLRYAAVIGPSGKMLYESNDKSISIDYINLQDNSLIGYTFIGDDLLWFISYPDGSELTMAVGDIVSPEIYGNRRIIWSTATLGDNLADAKSGVILTKKPYRNLQLYNDGMYIFTLDDRLVAVDGDGNEIYEFPDDIRGIRWDEASGFYIYSAYVGTYSSRGNQYKVGLMDRQFNKVTEALWVELNPSSHSGVFTALEYTDYETNDRIMYLVDATGKRITERDYNRIVFTGDNYSQKTARDVKPQLNDYFLAEYDTVDAYGGTRTETDLIDAEGKILLSDTDDLTISWVYGDYVTLILHTPGRQEAGGMKNILDNSELASPENGWLIPPIYAWIWYETGKNYLTAGISSNSSTRTVPIGESTVVFDCVRDRIAFTGDFLTINFTGYKNADGETRAGKGANGIFYAETATRKGYLNDRGEWIVSLSRFDTLEVDG